jgi:threonine/homoserine/homoserine lactone efflux protein
MGQAIGQIIVLALAVALSPVPIIAVVLMLSTPRGRVNATAFLAGWIVGMAVFGTIVVLAADGAEAREARAPALWVSILQIVLGVLLLALAVRQRKGHRRVVAERELPAWMGTIDAFSPVRSAGIAAVGSTISPKRLILLITAGTVIASTGASTPGQAVALVVFIVIGSMGVAMQVAIYFFAGDRATTMLEDLRDWMIRETPTMLVVTLLIVGAILIGHAISTLSG